MTQASSSPLSPAAEVLAPEDRPKVDHLITEDGTPVDSISHERQQRLLVESLYSSWAGPGEDRPFLAMSNVGLFYNVHQPPFVPNVIDIIGNKLLKPRKPYNTGQGLTKG